MPRKPKLQQKKSKQVSGRDLFQTPVYATNLLLPFIPKGVGIIWDCACGEGKIVRALLDAGYACAGTDLQQGIDFLEDDPPENYDAIVTNPPFSLKREFYQQCKGYGLPFALLIPADYAIWTIDAVRKDGAEKIIPTRRIDYITPNILMNICRGETWQVFYKNSEYKTPKDLPDDLLNEKFLYKSIYHVPPKLLRRYSSSYYHSHWLTWGFGIGKSETFVELTNEMKNTI